MFVSRILEKIEETRIFLKLSQGSVAVSQMMTNYVKAIFKLANNQLNKLKSAAKDKAGTTLRIKKEKLK